MIQLQRAAAISRSITLLISLIDSIYIFLLPASGHRVQKHKKAATSISLITALTLFLNYSIPAVFANPAFLFISSSCFSFGRHRNISLYPIPAIGVPFARRKSCVSNHSSHKFSNMLRLSVKVIASSKPCGGL